MKLMKVPLPISTKKAFYISDGTRQLSIIPRDIKLRTQALDGISFRLDSNSTSIA